MSILDDLQRRVADTDPPVGVETVSTNGELVAEPLPLARAFAASQYSFNRVLTLRCWRGEWFAWQDSPWLKLDYKKLRAEAYEWMELQRINNRPLKVRARHVSEFLDALAAITHLDIADAPAWLDGSADARAYIPFTNGVLRIDDAIEGKFKLLPPTPRLFTLNALPVAFNPSARCDRWLKTLTEYCADDDRIEALGRWFGYCLTPDTRHEIALLLIGPPRAGKSTILRTLARVVGEANVASISIQSLSDRFGLYPLLGKSLAIAADVHIGRGADGVQICERLKSIIGNDHQCVDRKHLPALPAVRLPIKFSLAANSFPRLPDASAAMRSRLLPIELTHTFAGREDRHLDEAIASETAGIILWAIEGLARLNEYGGFTLPKSSAEMLDNFSRLSSPVLGFVQDQCQLDPNAWVANETLWGAWKLWTVANGHEHGSRQRFLCDLRAAVPGVRAWKKREGDSTLNTQKGIKLVPDVPTPTLS